MIDNWKFKVEREYSKDLNTYEEARQHFLDDLLAEIQRIPEIKNKYCFDKIKVKEAIEVCVGHGDDVSENDKNELLYYLKLIPEEQYLTTKKEIEEC